MIIIKASQSRSSALSSEWVAVLTAMEAENATQKLSVKIALYIAHASLAQIWKQLPSILLSAFCANRINTQIDTVYKQFTDKIPDWLSTFHWPPAKPLLLFPLSPYPSTPTTSFFCSRQLFSNQSKEYFPIFSSVSLKLLHFFFLPTTVRVFPKNEIRLTMNEMKRSGENTHTSTLIVVPGVSRSHSVWCYIKWRERELVLSFFSSAEKK